MCAWRATLIAAVEVQVGSTSTGAAGAPSTNRLTRCPSTCKRTRTGCPEAAYAAGAVTRRRATPAASAISTAAAACRGTPPRISHAAAGPPAGTPRAKSSHSSTPEPSSRAVLHHEVPPSRA